MKRIFSTLFLLGCPLAASAQNHPTDTVNLVAKTNGGRVITATSTLGADAAYSANNLIDGQVFGVGGSKSRGWSSDKFDPIARDAVTFGFADNKVVTIGKLVLNAATDLPPERWAKDVEVQVSTETAEGPYASVAQLTLKQSANPQSFDILPTPARFVRLAFRSNYGSDRAVGLGEVEVYEAIDTADPMGSLISRLESAISDLSRYRQVQIQGGNGGGQVAPAALEGVSPATIQLVQLLGEGDAQVPIGRTNLVSIKNGGRVVAYSSIFNNDPQFGPDKLIDGTNFNFAEGKGSFGWSSQGFAPGNEYVTLGFPQDRTRLVGKIVLNPVSNQSDLRWARRVRVQATTGSFKDGPWKDVASLNIKGAKVDERGVNQEFLIRPVEAKYLRFIFLANGPGNISLPNADPNVNSDRAVSLGEIEVYEAATSNDQLGALIGKFNSILTDLKTLRRKSQDGGVAAE